MTSRHNSDKLFYNYVDTSCSNIRSTNDSDIEDQMSDSDGEKDFTLHVNDEEIKELLNILKKLIEDNENRDKKLNDCS